jgi:cytochrome c biogenesis protein CcmG, thiol:disulfide interchange protein DsbE
MNLRVILLTFVLVLTVSLRAAEEKLATVDVGDDTYKNVTVTRVTATDIYFSHDGGIANAKLKNLSPELQKKFHYDPAKADKAEAQKRAGAAQFAQEVAKAKQAEPAKPAPNAEEPPEENGTKTLLSGPLTNQRVPELVIEKWLTDVPELDGKFVVVDFWATWCGPCRKSIPELNAYSKKYSDKLVIVGLSDETELDVRRMKEPKIEYAVAIDTKARTLRAVGVKEIPHILLVDPKGIVRYQGNPSAINEKILEAIFAQFAE